MSFDEGVTAAMVADSLDSLGWRAQVLSPSIRPLDIGAAAIVGRARTVQFADAVDVDEAQPYAAAIAFIDSLKPGDVAIVATSDNLTTAYWGELFSAAALGRGAGGVVTDGCIRDVEKIAELGFPAFSAGYRPVDFRGRAGVVAVGARVRIGGVTIAQGDVVVADRDGVVIVPEDMLGKVTELANERSRAESTVLAELLGGDGLETVWRRHGVL
jgi:regulator of RNase E activity RraA